MRIDRTTAGNGIVMGNQDHSICGLRGYGMETRSCETQNKIIKRYSSDLKVKWLHCTVQDEKGITQEGDYGNPIPGSGRYAVYEVFHCSRQRRLRDELLYIVETPDGRFRDVHENIDFKLLEYSDKETKGCMNSANYNAAESWKNQEAEREEKENRRFSEENRAKAADMWGYVTKRPYITVGDTPWKKT